MTLTITKDRVGAVLKAVKSLTRTQVLVGVPASTSGRTPEEGEPEGITNAAIGYMAEFGSPARNIPERPHLVEGVRSVQDRVTVHFKKSAQAAIDGNAAGVAAGKEAAGLIATAAVQRKITEGPFTPLAASTITKRQAKGRTGTKPLIDTGQYRRAITYVVRNKGE